MKRVFVAAVLAAFALAAAPASAATINLTVSQGGLDGVQTRTCDDSTCATALWSLATGELYAATGTITIDTTANTMTISLAVATSVLDADPSKGQANTSDGATSLVFTGGTYTTVAIPITSAPGAGGTTIYTIASGQEGSVAFTNVVANGTTGTGGPLSLGAVRVSGNCTLQVDNTGICGISFGASGTTNFRIPTNATLFGTYDRWVKHTLDVTVVPEPATAALLALGLGSVALLRRRAR